MLGSRFRNFGSWRALLVSCVIGGSAIASCAPPPDLTNEAVRMRPPTVLVSPMSREVAEGLLRRQLRTEETLTEVVPWTLASTGRVIAVGVARSPTGARRFEVDDRGAPVVLEDLLAAEAEMTRAIRGKMTPGLDAIQRPLADDSVIDFTVMVPAHFDYPSPPFNGRGTMVSVDEFNAHMLAHRAANRMRLEESKRDLVEWLRAEGATVIDYDSIPAVDVRGPVRMLRDLRLEGDDVETIVEPPSSSETSPLLTHAAQGSMNQAGLTGGFCGSFCDGGGLGVGIWEVGLAESLSSKRGAIATNNTRLQAIAADTYRVPPTPCSTNADCPQSQPYGETYRCGPSGKCLAEHRSLVAGMLGMQGDYTYGPAVPGLGGVNFQQPGTPNIVRFVVDESGLAGFNWYLNQASAYVNRSEDSTDSGSTSVVANWAARYDNVLLTVAAGNDGGATVANSLFINAVSVGGFRYEVWNDPATHRRNGAFSCYLNNNSVWPGLERPNLLGPESHFNGSASYAGLHVPVITANNANTISSTTLTGNQAIGTSLSAPAVLSVALRAHYYAGLFSDMYYPVVRKAVLLAATRDSNADGPVTKGTTWSATPDGEDGAGHPDLGFLKSLLDAGSFHYVLLDDSMLTSCGPGCRRFQLAAINVPANSSLKASLVWSACVTAPGATTTSPPTDFDLILNRPSYCGGVVQSVSVNNEVEMVYDSCVALAPRGAYTYSLEVRTKNGANIATPCGASEPIGVAWSLQ